MGLFNLPRLNTIPRRIYSERRRLLLVTALAFVAGYIFYMPIDVNVFGMPVPVFTGTLYAVFVGVAALMTCLFLPALRFTIEAIALSRLVFALTVVQFPEIGFKLMASPFANATIVVGGAFVLNRLFYSQWSKRSLMRRNHKTTVVLSSRLNAAVLDQAFHRAQDGRTLVELDQLLPGHSGDKNTANQDIAPRIQSVNVVDKGRVRQVTLQLHYPRRAWYSILTCWLDDAYGRLQDQLTAPLNAPLPARISTVSHPDFA